MLNIDHKMFTTQQRTEMHQRVWESKSFGLSVDTCSKLVQAHHAESEQERESQITCDTLQVEKKLVLLV